MDRFLDKSVFTLKRPTEELKNLIRLKLSRVLANNSFKKFGLSDRMEAHLPRFHLTGSDIYWC
ncbi:hypothetical protein CMK14_19520 [Candidatus Poribacteria bacterium]|nr:hypothetical protein [Candidatus Poribacteria bacterium]